jgi:hypothetical protein
MQFNIGDEALKLTAASIPVTNRPFQSHPLASSVLLKLQYSPYSRTMECSSFKVNKNKGQAVKRHHFHISHPSDKEQTI